MCNPLTALQVRKFVIRREVQPKGEGKKSYTKAPKIQRLITPQRLQHKRHRIALKKRRAESSKDAAVRFRPSIRFIYCAPTNNQKQHEYAVLQTKRLTELKSKRSEIRKRRASSMRTAPKAAA